MFRVTFVRIYADFVGWVLGGTRLEHVTYNRHPIKSRDTLPIVNYETQIPQEHTVYDILKARLLCQQLV
jgi:hypothetical protein